MTPSNLFKLFSKSDKKILAVNFHASSIEIVCLKRLAEKFQLLAFDVKKISGANGQSDIISFIDGFRKKNAVHQKDIILSISDCDVVAIKYVVLPVLPDEEILEAARWQLKEEVPFDLADAIFDWCVVRDFTDEEGAKKKGIIFIAAQRESVDEYLSLLHQCHLEATCIVNGSFSYINILKCFSDQLSISAILDVGYGDSTLNVYINNQLSLVRRLPFSVEKFVQSLQGILISERGKIEFSQTEAQEIAEMFGIPQDRTQIIKDHIQAAHIISLMRPLLEILTREIKFSFDYFASSLEAQRPLRLYLSGCGANLKNLDSYLAKELNITVSSLPFPACLDTPTAHKGNQNEILNVCAAALKDETSINLIPPEIKQKQAQLIQKAFLRVAGITVGAIFLLVMFMTEFQIRDYNNRLKIATLHLGTINSVETLRRDISIKRDLMNAIQKNEITVNGILRAISALTPQKIILDDLLLTKSSYHLQIRGKVFADENAAEGLLVNFINQLEALPFFSEISLGSLKTQGNMQTFDIACDLAHEELTP